jgi:hypothetical protein
LINLSVLDAEVQRLNTLNRHIASKSNIDINDFDLLHSPAQGGILESNYFGSTVVRNNDIKNSVSKIERNLNNQKLKLKNLVASLEIKEAEDYLAKLSHINEYRDIQQTAKNQNNESDV